MLKKLFISLLILSTLASEGLVNFPANVFSFYLATGKVLDLLENETTPGEQNNVIPRTNVSAFKAESNGSFVLSINSLSKLSFEILNEAQNLEMNLNKPGLQLGICDSIFVLSNRLITFRSSDSSPPLNSTSKEFGNNS